MFAYYWSVRLLVGPLRDGRRRRIAVLVRTLRDRVGVSPTRLLAMVNAAAPVPFEKSHSVAPRRYPWGEVERRFGWDGIRGRGVHAPHRQLDRLSARTAYSQGTHRPIPWRLGTTRSLVLAVFTRVCIAVGPSRPSDRAAN